MQIKKSKLISIKNRHGLNDREFLSIVTPEIAREVLKEYMTLLTRTGNYFTLDNLVTIINTSDKFKQSKKDKLVLIVGATKKYQGIANLLKNVEDGSLTEFEHCLL